MFLNALVKSVNMPCDLLGLVYTSNCECDVALSCTLSVAMVLRDGKLLNGV